MQEKFQKQILLIEDEAPERKLFRRKFAHVDYDIIEAVDGIDGLNLYREHRPDLVVTDLIMPESEGIETIKKLRELDPDLKIIAVSGGGGVGAADLNLKIAKHLGAQEIFSKPIDWKALIETVKGLLS